MNVRRGFSLRRAVVSYEKGISFFLFRANYIRSVFSNFARSNRVLASNYYGVELATSTTLCRFYHFFRRFTNVRTFDRRQLTRRGRRHTFLAIFSSDRRRGLFLHVTFPLSLRDRIFSNVRTNLAARDSRFSAVTLGNFYSRFFLRRLRFLFRMITCLLLRFNVLFSNLLSNLERIQRVIRRHARFARKVLRRRNMIFDHFNHCHFSATRAYHSKTFTSRARKASRTNHESVHAATRFSEITVFSRASFVTVLFARRDRDTRYFHFNGQRVTVLFRQVINASLFTRRLFRLASFFIHRFLRIKRIGAREVKEGM